MSKVHRFFLKISTQTLHYTLCRLTWTCVYLAYCFFLGDQNNFFFVLIWSNVMGRYFLYNRLRGAAVYRRARFAREYTRYREEYRNEQIYIIIRRTRPRTLLALLTIDEIWSGNLSLGSRRRKGSPTNVFLSKQHPLVIRRYRVDKKIKSLKIMFEYKLYLATKG